MEKTNGKHQHKKIGKKQYDGNHTFETGHIEHAMLDVFLVCPNTKLIMGRPWVTFLMDGNSKGLLATIVGLEAPSYKYIEKTLQECIKNYSRLPNTIILERGYGGYGKGLEDLVYKYNFNFELDPKII